MGSGLELSPAATQAICRRRNSKIVYMMLCNNFVHSMPCRNGVERRREKGFTFVWLLRLCCSVCLAPIPRDIQCRFVSHDGRLHIAHRISSTIHEWMNGVQCAEIAFLPSPQTPSNPLPLWFRRRMFEKAVCTFALGKWSPEHIMISCIPMFCIRRRRRRRHQPNRIGTHKTDIPLCLRFFPFLIPFPLWFICVPILWEKIFLLNFTFISRYFADDRLQLLPAKQRHCRHTHTIKSTSEERHFPLGRHWLRLCNSVEFKYLQLRLDIHSNRDIRANMRKMIPTQWIACRSQ